MNAPLLLGVDFTSAPSRRKPITVASGWLRGNTLAVADMERCADWARFEAVLQRPGPWVGGFDFPFGLPRALVVQLDWPQNWAGLIRHIHTLSKPAFKAALDGVRERRPMGSRYLHRACDGPARSHSPMKLVNPPVGLMFFEGAPRLLAAGLSLPGLHAGDPQRLALEAYPALLARRFTQASYKSDERARQTPERRAEREKIIMCLNTGAAELTLKLSPALTGQLLDDASGDSLDAVLALLQAARAWQLREAGFGLPADVDPLEGWIIGCPG
ncbi:DUF429 domain-containing protein [Uliginosibacterium aquaticum]|uniref:DUF429 domain-containing protein n=1 Tax=Uliginosibacterium aquaticum TaxID=2731212 RepID=A0ABX2IRZ5_9RHOO|nr:DUF429 domain-containing protein [Uliginosibacterium aquaticum]NSL56993.1 DUF429 domain-containing protein [Uliginosibacterium aquaticum]